MHNWDWFLSPVTLRMLIVTNHLVEPKIVRGPAKEFFLWRECVNSWLQRLTYQLRPTLSSFLFEKRNVKQDRRRGSAFAREPFLFSMNTLTVPEVLWFYWRRFDGSTRSKRGCLGMHSRWVFQTNAKYRFVKEATCSACLIGLSH